MYNYNYKSALRLRTSSLNTEVEQKVCLEMVVIISDSVQISVHSPVHESSPESRVHVLHRNPSTSSTQSSLCSSSTHLTCINLTFTAPFYACTTLTSFFTLLSLHWYFNLKKRAFNTIHSMFSLEFERLRQNVGSKNG